MNWFYQNGYLKNPLKKIKIYIYIYNPKTLKQIARENFELDDKQLNKELGKKMINPYYFTDRVLKIGPNVNSDGHHINHAYSKLTITAHYSKIGIAFRYIIEIIKVLSIIYARLLYQYKFKYQTIFSARFYKKDEDNQMLDETELFIILNINHKLRETDIDKIDIKFP